MVDGDEICACELELVIGVGVKVVTISVPLPFNAFMALIYFLWKCVCGVVDICIVDVVVVDCVLGGCCGDTVLIILAVPLMAPLFVDTIT